MTLLCLQAAQARLYLDPAARDALRRGDRSLAAEFCLDAAEFDQLHRLAVDHAEGLEIFGEMLVRKRNERLGQLYPILQRYLGDERWDAAFDGYVRQRPVPPTSVTEDAIGFGHYLEECAALHTDGGIASDLIVFERTKAEVAGDSPRSAPASAWDRRRLAEMRPILAPSARIRTLRHSPSQLVERIVGGGTAPLEQPAGGVTVVFFLGTGDIGVKASEVGAWLGAILRRADGRASLDEILSAMGLADDHAVIDHLVDVLTALAGIGMIASSPEEPGR